MNRLPSSVRQLVAALRGLLIFTVICGIIYPVVMFGIAQAAFHARANGSMVSYNGRWSAPACSARSSWTPRATRCRSTSSPARPTRQAAPRTTTAATPATRRRPTWARNPVLVNLIKTRQKQIAAFDHVKISSIPPDAVTASASGLEPFISPQNAAIQVDRVAAARHISLAAVRALVPQHTQGRTLGFLGEPRVNVLLLNIALDQKYPVS